MQVGTQSRGTPTIRNGIQLLRDGAIGKVLVAKAWNSQRRANIGHQKPSDPPSGFDYDLWVGPAPMRPYQSNCQHGTWHWWYDFGTGDAGNDGVHELDIASWGLGVDTHPSRVSGHGSKIYFDDDQQFPDTQYVVYEYPPKDAASPKQLLVYEHRIWSPYHQEGAENGCAFYGTEGYMILAKATGWKVYGPRDKLIREESGGLSMPDHAADFLAAIRDHRRPNADIEIGHRSAVLSHLANILARTGRPGLTFDPGTQRFIDAPDADALIGRAYRENHWAAPKGA
jgi:predicted dehydrogenase